MSDSNEDSEKNKKLYWKKVQEREKKKIRYL